MDLFQRYTRIKNTTTRPIAIQPFRCSETHRIEDREIIIAPQEQIKVKPNEFSYEEIIPQIHGILEANFVGDERHSPATFTARQVKICTHIFLKEDRDGLLYVTGFPETVLDYIPFGRTLISQRRTEVPIFMQST